jgi:hypothetical protein
VGISSVKAILGNRTIPGVLDEYLAHKAYSGQQTDEPRDPDQPCNLWTPVRGDGGAHGTFDDRAQRFSPQLWATEHREWLGVLAAAAAGLGLGTWLGKDGG